VNSATWHYTRDQLIDAIREVGIDSGDIVSLQVSLGRLGLPKDVPFDYAAISNLVFDAFLEVVGPQGTLIVPTYTYSIGRGEVFEVETTPSAIRAFAEQFRQRPGVIRSRDPMLSTVGIGPAARLILREISRECYGLGSVFDNLTRLNAVVCTLGLGLWWATFCHYIEAMADAPFRFRKALRGIVREGGQDSLEEWIYFAAPYIENCQSNSLALEAEARAAGILRTAAIGRAEIAAARAPDLLNVGLAGLRKNPWLTAKGPACETEELIRLEDRRVGATSPRVEVPAGATLLEMIDAVWALPRDPVSSGYDAALAALARQLPMTVRRYPTGRQCGSYLVPEKWTCRAGALQDAQGGTIFAAADNCLHVASRSFPFEGEVSRDELLEHLHVHPVVPDATPHQDLAGRRDWGLCCSEDIRQKLTDDRYRVAIDSAFSYGALSVGEVLVPGASEETIVISTRLDGGRQANDGLSGVVVGIDIMRTLAARAATQFSYRLLIVPGPEGLSAYLDDHDDQAARVCGALHINLAGLCNPLTLETPAEPARAFERCCLAVLKRFDPALRVDRGMTESQWHVPGLPMLSLARPNSQIWRDHGLLFREHRSDRDNPALVSPEKLKATRDAVLAVIDRWEADAADKSGRAVSRRHPEAATLRSPR
jgi:aminopeptidase-like protein/aminoglycoside N3'-acetyltransferase